MIATHCYPVPMDTEHAPFGDWLQAAIDQRGWTVSDLARAIDARAATVSRWRLNQRIPRPDQCRKIATALDLDPLVVLYHAGHVSTLPQPESSYETRRVIDDIQRKLEGLQAREVETEAGIPVRYYGVVPADRLRWVSGEGSEQVRLVPPSWMRRSPNDYLVVTASGDCLLPRGIADGHDVLIERAGGREPRNGQIVLIRVRDEYSLKIWQRDGDWIELRDGRGIVIHRFSIFEDADVIGFYKGNWKIEP